MKPFAYIASCVLLLIVMSNNAVADTKEILEEYIVSTEASATVGYQSFSLRNEAGRAAEYRSFSSSPTFGLDYFSNAEGAHFRVNADYLSDEDYNAEINYNKGSLFRLDLRSERFFHNLDHIPYDNGYLGNGNNRVQDHAPVEGSRPDGLFRDDVLADDVRNYYTDWNPNADYGQRIDINEVKVRAKLPTYPAHINLAYWRMEKKGHRQMRFVDENCTGCHMQSRTRKIDRVTNEIKGSIDGHLGYVDLEAIALYREFKDNESIPVNYFDRHARGPFEDRSAGFYDHAEDPDSTVKEFTLRANTSPSGGLVGSTSITFGKRENESDLNSIRPVKAETDYFKTSADVTYTPSKFWTVNLRHRYLDLDNDNSDTLRYPDHGSLNQNDLAVREAIDFTRAWYEIIGNYRPSANLTVKAELRREDIKRDQTGPPAEHHSQTVLASAPPTQPIEIDPYWELPDEESITRLKLGFRSRHLEKSALKLSGWVMLKHNNDPAYGTSYSDSTELFLSANYNPSPFWGLAASVDILDEENDDRTVAQFYDTDLYVNYDLDRERQQQNISLGSWLIPADGLSFDVNYGYLATQIKQDLLFGNDPDPIDAATDFTIRNDNVDYEQTVHTISAGASWQPLENLNCRVEGYHIRSEASYDPDFAEQAFLYDDGAIPGVASSSGLKEISKIDIRQNGIKGRVNWQIDDSWSCSVEATYDKYDDKNSDVFDGSVSSYTASLTRTW